jgi:RNA polymerase sigma factor (TIGR02999 family)
MSSPPMDRPAADTIPPAVYRELRTLAAARLAEEGHGLSFQPTDLVHEAYLRLAKAPNGCCELQNRGEFFASAGEVMRRILVDRARKRRAKKRGGGRQKEALGDVVAASPTDQVDVLALDEALTKLEATSQRLAQLVKLRFFAGLSIDQVAEALGVCSTTVDNDWAYVKTWLRVEINGRDGSASAVE